MILWSRRLNLFSFCFFCVVIYKMSSFGTYRGGVLFCGFCGLSEQLEQETARPQGTTRAAGRRRTTKKSIATIITITTLMITNNNNNNIYSNDIADIVVATIPTTTRRTQRKEEEQRQEKHKQPAAAFIIKKQNPEKQRQSSGGCACFGATPSTCNKALSPIYHRLEVEYRGIVVKT